jgi:cell division protein FtsI/penicillin-binding protein 2
MDLPSERLELARSAAGFWHMHMSPLHAALIASSVAADGVMPRPSMIERVVDANGVVLQSFSAQSLRTVIAPATAHTLGHMMERTITDGTSRSAFYEHRKPYLPGISVAGKTGSLNADNPFRAYSWWVGFAPVEQPKIALAALIVNTPKWRIKSSFLAREALREYLVPAQAPVSAPKASAASASRAPAAQPRPISAPPPPADASPSRTSASHTDALPAPSHP